MVIKKEIFKFIYHLYTDELSEQKLCSTTLLYSIKQIT